MTFGTPLERFEAKFVSLLAQARLLPALLFELMGAAAPNGVRSDQFPEATVLRLNYAAMVQYHAAVAALAEPETALGSLSLLRSLIEAWAHLYFIWGKGNLSEAACRAIRFEQGTAAQAFGLAMAASPTDSEMVKAAVQWQRDLEALRTQLGCKGGWRDYTWTKPSNRWLPSPLAVSTGCWVFGGRRPKRRTALVGTGCSRTREMGRTISYIRRLLTGLPDSTTWASLQQRSTNVPADPRMRNSRRRAPA